MAFVLLVRDGSVVRLLDSAVFETRQEALAAIPRADAPGETEELFLVDLETASPIIVVPQAVTPAPDVSEESSAGVWEAPPEPEEVPESPVAAEAEPADLSTALRRATGALESAGIVAPESVVAVPEVAEQPVPEVAEQPVPEVAEEPIAPDVAPAGWPWDVSPDQEDAASGELAAEAPPEADSLTAPERESAPVPEPVPAPEPEPELLSAPETFSEPTAEPVETYVPDPFEEPARDVEEFVYREDASEALSLNRPVIMGAYGDDASAVSAAETDEGQPPDDEAESQNTAVEAVAPSDSALRGDLEDIALGLDSEPGSVEEVVGEVATPSMPEDEPFTPAFEAGTSDIAELTCDECVYINTCPKKGESDPSSCGSFQWKSI